MALPLTRYALRYGSLPFERTRDHARPPPPYRETPSNAHPIVTAQQVSLAIPLLHHIYAIRFAGGLGECGERRGPVVGGAGGAAERQGGDRRADFVHFGGRNCAYLHRACVQKSVGRMRFLRVLWGPSAVACAHMLSTSLLYIVVCVLCACGSGKNHLSAPYHLFRRRDRGGVDCRRARAVTTQ